MTSRAMLPPAIPCSMCGRYGHAADAHTNPDAAAYVWARIVLCIGRHRLEGGSRLLLEEQAAVWSERTLLLMWRAKR